MRLCLLNLEFLVLYHVITKTFHSRIFAVHTWPNPEMTMLWETKVFIRYRWSRDMNSLWMKFRKKSILTMHSFRLRQIKDNLTIVKILSTNKRKTVDGYGFSNDNFDFYYSTQKN